MRCCCCCCGDLSELAFWLRVLCSLSIAGSSTCRRSSFDKFLREDIVYLDGFAACYQLCLKHAEAEPNDVRQALQQLLESVRVEQERQQADLQVQNSTLSFVSGCLMMAKSRCNLWQASHDQRAYFE